MSTPIPMPKGFNADCEDCRELDRMGMKWESVVEILHTDDHWHELVISDDDENGKSGAR